jgi:hypothetical protein
MIEFQMSLTKLAADFTIDTREAYFSAHTNAVTARVETTIHTAEGTAEDNLVFVDSITANTHDTLVC